MLRVGCGNSVRNHRPQWPLSPASRFQVVRALSRGGRLWGAGGARKIISWERKVPPLDIEGVRSGRHQRELSIRRQRIQPTMTIGRIQWFWSELLLSSRPSSMVDIVHAK